MNDGILGQELIMFGPSIIGEMIGITILEAGIISVGGILGQFGRIILDVFIKTSMFEFSVIDFTD